MSNDIVGNKLWVKKTVRHRQSPVASQAGPMVINRLTVTVSLLVSLWRRRPLFVITVRWNVLRIPRANSSYYRTDPDRARLLKTMLDCLEGIKSDIYGKVGKKITELDKS